MDLPVVTPEPRKSIAPWIKDSVEYYDHQIVGIRTMANMTSFLCADDMGLGKSLQALTVFAIDVYRKWAKTAIVVCPVTLKGNWADEIEKFTGFKFIRLEGTPKEREVLLEEFRKMDGPNFEDGVKMLIVNYEQVVAHKDALDRMRFDVAIFDEAHYLKNPKAKRTKACLDLYSRRSFMLTGTPMLNHVNELWSILHRINPREWPNYYTFVNRYVVYGGYKDKQVVGVKNEAELTERLKAVMIRRLKKDVLNLPEVQYIQRRVDLHPEQARLYNEVVNEMRLPMEGADDQEIENALTKFLRLKQICGTTLPFTGEDHSTKLDQVLEDDAQILENGERVVVFTQFRDVQAAYAKRAEKLKVPIYQLHGDVPQAMRSEIVKEWGSTPQPGVLVCMLQVAGVGLNMTQSRHGSFVDKLFVPGLNQQAVDRLNRIGASETQSIQIREYICRDTIENRVEQILRTKKKLSDEIVETDPNWKRTLVKAMWEEINK